MTESWWSKPRHVTIVVDNDGWFLPWANELASRVREAGDTVVIARSHADVPEGDVAFYLSCTGITPPDILSRNQKNLVVHESGLPEGRGFAPMTWQILEGRNDIPIVLLEITEEADAGPVVYRDGLEFDGHELNGDLRRAQAEALHLSTGCGPRPRWIFVSVISARKHRRHRRRKKGRQANIGGGAPKTASLMLTGP